MKPDLQHAVHRAAVQRFSVRTVIVSLARKGQRDRKGFPIAREYLLPGVITVAVVAQSVECRVIVDQSVGLLGAGYRGADAQSHAASHQNASSNLLYVVS